MTMQDICCGHENKYPVVTERKLHHGNVILVGKFNKNQNICLSRCEGITDSKPIPDENISKALKVHNSTKQIVKSDCRKPLICTGPSVGSKIGKCMVGTGLPEVVIESQEAQPIQENCQTATVSITVQKDTQNDKLKPETVEPSPAQPSAKPRDQRPVIVIKSQSDTALRTPREDPTPKKSSQTLIELIDHDYAKSAFDEREPTKKSAEQPNFHTLTASSELIKRIVDVINSKTVAEQLKDIKSKSVAKHSLVKSDTPSVHLPESALLPSRVTSKKSRETLKRVDYLDLPVTELSVESRLCKVKATLNSEILDPTELQNGLQSTLEIADFRPISPPKMTNSSVKACTGKGSSNHIVKLASCKDAALLNKSSNSTNTLRTCVRPTQLNRGDSKTHIRLAPWEQFVKPQRIVCVPCPKSNPFTSRPFRCPNPQVENLRRVQHVTPYVRPDFSRHNRQYGPMYQTRLCRVVPSSKSLLDEALDGLMDYWKNYLATSHEEMQQKEIKRAQRDGYNDLSMSMIGDTDSYVWQLIEELGPSSSDMSELLAEGGDNRQS